MNLPVQAEPVPLRDDGGGGLRVGNSRVTLDTLIEEFENGADPESIVHGYPTLDLADVYAVITYYLRHRQEVHEYLRRREEEAEKLRQEIEATQPDRAQLRAKLLARRGRQGQGNGSARG
jgi:uncharacterized protein (DUF433 family)